MTCKNCSENISGNFCSYCGQPTKVDKINLAYVLNEFSSSIFQLNYGLIFTVLALIKRPGHSMREYLAGKRKYYFKPISYVLLLSTIYYLFTGLVEDGTFLSEAISGFVRGARVENDQEVPMFTFLSWLANNYAYTTLLLLPLFSLASYLAYFTYSLNYFEHFILNAYITGQQALIYSSFILIQYVLSSYYYLPLIPLGLSMVYMFWTCRQLFEHKKTGEIMLRTLFAYFIYLIFLLFLSAVIGFVVLALRK